MINMKWLESVSAIELYQMAGYSKKRKRIPVGLEELNPILLMSSANELSLTYSCIFNWAYMRYTYVSPSIQQILGYDEKVFLEEGLNFILKIIHPDDLKMLKEIHHTIFNYFYITPVKQRSRLRFSYNFRIKKKDESYIHILRQSNFLEFTEDGKPVIEYIQSTDITDFNNQQHIKLTVHKLTYDGSYELCYIHKFSDNLHRLSERENQVFEFIRMGYTTKEIANKLYLSIETIKSHRKHILAKIGTRNMTSAICMKEQKLNS
jgi:DNA-binding CsgD family transcriptional regulator